MRTKILMMSMALVALAFTSCNKDENEMEGDNWNGEIRMGSGLAGQASPGFTPDTQIAKDQLAGIYGEKVKGDMAAYTGYANVSVRADGAGNFSDYSTPMYYPQSGQGVVISAYHPYNDAAANQYAFTVESNQALDGNYYKSDLLYAEKKEFARTKVSHSLAFNHKLSKVVCNLTAGAGAPTIEKAVVEIITPERAVQFDRTTGVVGKASTSVRSGNVTLGQYGAIIAPQTYTQGDKFLQVTLLSGGKLYYTIPSPKLVLEGGSVYTFNITVNLTSLTVSSTINPWIAVSDVDGGAEME